MRIEMRIDRWLPILAIVFSSIAMVVSVYLWLDSQSRVDHTAAQTEQIARQTAAIKNQAKDIAIEGKKRRDQTCTLNEGTHLADVKQLRNTYRYLTQLKPEERASTINVFVLRSLPELERKARHDGAPAFCDEPNVGLPEPDPVVPKRPASLAVR